MDLNAFFHRHLPEVWLRRGPVAWALWPASVVYGALVALRRWAYATAFFASQRVPAVVIVVGNVVAGGAGKTPITIAVTRHLLARGLQVGVISRGHGRQTQDTRVVTASSQALEVGDEPLLIHQSTGVPVWVGRHRADAARQLLAAHPQVQVLICDDGLQHLALARDIDICVMDERGTGNGFLLPAGPLREPWPRPVNLLVHTGPMASALEPGMHQAPRQLADHAVTRDGQRIPLQHLAQQNTPLHAVAGLARPQAFFDMLRQSGLQLASTTALPDHDDYAHWVASPEKTWLCTEKDAAKLWAHEPRALAVPLVVAPDLGFWQALDAQIAPLLDHGSAH